MAECGLIVAPARRRAGFGTALAAHCAGQARRAGRSRLTSTGAPRTKVRECSPGAAFAADAGARTGLAELIMTQDIDADLLARLTSLRASAEQRSAGYDLVSWLGVSPDEHIDQFARVSGAMSDAPRDAGVQPQQWDVTRIRNAEELAIGNDLRYYSRQAGASSS